jgi:ATP-binding cassette subfamily B protein/ATP-binding cassette subfamily C protein
MSTSRRQSKDFRIEKEEEGKGFDFHLIRRLWRYVHPYRVLFYVSLAMLLCSTVLQLFIPYVTKDAIDSFMIREPRYLFSEKYTEGYYQITDSGWIREHPEGDYVFKREGEASFLTNGFQNIPLTGKQIRELRITDIRGLDKSVYILLFLLVSVFITNYIQVYFSNKMGQRVIYDIRRNLFSHILRLPLKFFDHNPSGRIVTRITNDTENLNEFFTSAVTSILKDVLLIVGIVGFMFFLSQQLTGYSMLVLPVIVVATALFRYFDRKTYRKVRTRLARINAFLAEHLAGMSVIQLFNRETAKENEFEETNHSYYRATLQQLTVFAIFRPTMDILFYVALCIVIWFGSKDLISGILTFGTLYAFINYIDMFFQPLKDISEKFDIVQNALSSSEKIFKLMDETEGLEPETPKGKEKVEKGAIVFSDVVFGYSTDNEVLKNITFSVNPGEKIAVVGETGAGKTSMIGILTGLYPIKSGIIEIDETPIEQYNIQQLRSSIAVVLQDVFIFSGNIIDNIRLFDNTISREETIEAARFVHVDHLIKKFEKGYDTLLNERASTLSAGERQLIALARAVVRKPKILILDEATANIDPVTEGYIQDALEKVTAERTVIVIAHRLSTIKNAHRILVFHKGRIVEAGTHAELFEKNGVYTQLYRLQYELN